jgi:hypothetical protein
MQAGSLVECIKGSPGIIEEGSIYTVYDVVGEGHLILVEIEPPPPHNCFHRERFKEVQPPMDIINLIENIIHEYQD